MGDFSNHLFIFRRKTFQMIFKGIKEIHFLQHLQLIKQMASMYIAFWADYSYAMYDRGHF